MLLSEPAPRCEAAELNAMNVRVGRALGRARMAAGLSTARLAATAGMDILDLALCEAGRRRARAHELLELTTALGIRPSDLYA